MIKRLDEMEYRLPQPIIKFATGSTGIGELVRNSSGYSADDYPWADRMLGRFPLPSWQRGLVWSGRSKKAKSLFILFFRGSTLVRS
jgi:hypothetical protein